MIGIDPGFGRTGIGLIEFKGGDPKHIWHTTIVTPPDLEFAERLETVRNEVIASIQTYKPDAACLESLFFQTNAKTAMKVAMARGVILLALHEMQLPTVELTPSQVKSGIAGWGNADKEQVQMMVARLLGLQSLPEPDDAADALALAIVGGTVYRQAVVMKGL